MNLQLRTTEDHDKKFKERWNAEDMHVNPEPAMITNPVAGKEYLCEFQDNGERIVAIRSDGQFEFGSRLSREDALEFALFRALDQLERRS